MYEKYLYYSRFYGKQYWKLVSLCIIPQFPIELDKHNYNEWKKLLDVYYKDFNMITNDSIIIGHSTGSICALKYVLENEIKIDKLILVSGFNNYLSADEALAYGLIDKVYSKRG